MIHILLKINRPEQFDTDDRIELSNDANMSLNLILY